MTSGVYTITAPSGNQYVGSAFSLAAREKQHFNRLKRGVHRNERLNASFQKYQGRLIFKPLLICAPEMLLFYEQRAIDILKPKYNICPVAGNSLGTTHSELSKAKMAATKLGKKRWPPSAETRAKMSKSNIGKRLGMTHSDECKAMLSAKHKTPEAIAREHAWQVGYSPSPETRAKTSVSIKAALINISPEKRAKMLANLRPRVKRPPDGK